MDSCPKTGEAHLVVNYLFDSVGSRMRDRSGNRHDAVLHDNKWCADYPELSCIYQEEQLEKRQDEIPVGEHGQATVGCTTCKKGKNLATSDQKPVDIALSLKYTN